MGICMHGGRHCCRSNICSNSDHKSDKSMVTWQWGWGVWAFRLSWTHLTNFTIFIQIQTRTAGYIFENIQTDFWKNCLKKKRKIIFNPFVISRNIATYILLLQYSVFLFCMKTCANHRLIPGAFYVVSCPLFEFVSRLGLRTRIHCSCIWLPASLFTETRILNQSGFWHWHKRRLYCFTERPY